MSENIYKIEGYTFIHKKDMNEEDWLDTRREGVGGSDIGVITGVNPYASRTELFYEKLGMGSNKDLTDNESVFWGKTDESTILDVTQYWGGEFKYTTNKKLGFKQASHVDFNFFTINDDMPWLQMNVDGLGFYDTNLKEEDVVTMILNGMLPTPDKVIEIKTIEGRTADKYVNGVPAGYLDQVYGYLAVWLKANPDIFGELYSRVNGNSLRRLEIQYDIERITQIVEMTHDFHVLVQQGKEIIKNGTSQNQIRKGLAEIEPAADSSSRYEEFISQQEKDKVLRSENKYFCDDPKFHDIVVEYKSVAEISSDVEERKKELSNQIKERMRKEDTTIIEFEDGSYVKFARRLYVKIINN